MSDRHAMTAKKKADTPQARDDSAHGRLVGNWRRRADARAKAFEELGPWASSAIVHGIALLILALWTIPLYVSGELFIDAAFSGDADFAFDPVSQITSPPIAGEQGDDTQEQQNAVNELSQDEFAKRLSARDRQELPTRLEQQPGATTSGEAGPVRHSASVEGAVDRITGGIDGRLQQGDLLVVWLLDSSESLVDDRQRVADRLAPFFEKTSAERNANTHKLVNAVVSYGNRTRERVAPTEFGKQILSAVKQLPVDASGKENVFAAVEQSAVKYRKLSKQKQVLIVVWTDESGDDVQKLEHAIEACRKQGVAVSVVGPSAVLGARMGTHAYTHPKTQIVYRLPVMRGPDAPLPERLSLGYWYRARFPRWSTAQRSLGQGGGRRRVGLPPWYGDNHLTGLVSGFSPYALSRLAEQTGGNYTIFDRPEDRGPFEPESMRKYAPDRRSAADYLEDVQRHPLRRAVHSAVELTHDSPRLGPPPLMLFGRFAEPPPYQFQRFYFTPTQFRGKLRSSQRSLTREAARIGRVVERALAELSPNGEIHMGLEEAYEQETSPRWRAWYDLTRGRITYRQR